MQRWSKDGQMLSSQGTHGVLVLPHGLSVADTERVQKFEHRMVGVVAEQLHYKLLHLTKSGKNRMN